MVETEISKMIDYIKEVSSLIYGKEVFFYEKDENRWYSRDHCRYVEFEEIIDWLREYINPHFIEN